MAAERGLRIGTFAGAPIIVDPTILLLAAYVVGTSVMDGGMAALPFSLAFLGALLLGVLLHEFGHAGVAAALQLKSKRIVLTFFGGHVEFERQPEKRWQDIAVSFAGPAVNLATFAILVYGPLAGPDIEADPFGAHETNQLLTLFLGYLANVSLLLGLFNLLPGFPLDGGRILSAALSYLMSRQRALFVTACFGLVIALCVMAWAAWQQRWFTLVIGVLLAGAAWAEIRRAREAMNQPPSPTISNA
ncbi:MAG: site-2 protease family protein [Terricaulis sp.]